MIPIDRIVTFDSFLFQMVTIVHSLLELGGNPREFGKAQSFGFERSVSVTRTQEKSLSF